MRKRTSKQIFAETLLDISRRKSVDKITVQQIVDESGLSVQTFYNHFRDKADLILWIHKSKFDELLEKLGKDGYTYRDLTLENLRFYLDHKDYMWNALNHTHGQDAYWRASAENAYRVLHHAISAGFRGRRNDVCGRGRTDPGDVRRKAYQLGYHRVLSGLCTDDDPGCGAWITAMDKSLRWLNFGHDERCSMSLFRFSLELSGTLALR